jgi:hypothetical protein
MSEFLTSGLLNISANVSPSPASDGNKLNAAIRFFVHIRLSTDPRLKHRPNNIDSHVYVHCA